MNLSDLQRAKQPSAFYSGASGSTAATLRLYVPCAHAVRTIVLPKDGGAFAHLKELKFRGDCLGFEIDLSQPLAAGEYDVHSVLQTLPNELRQVVRELFVPKYAKTLADLRFTVA